METRRKFTHTQGLWTILLIGVCSIFFSFSNFHGISLSDSYNYAESAAQIADGTFELTGSVFKNRLGNIVPVTALIEMFGPSHRIMVLWSFLCFLILLAGTYIILSKHDPQIAVIATGLLALNPLLLYLSSDLFPDVVMTAFSTIALLALFHVTNNDKVNPVFWGTLFAIGFFCSFVTKLTLIYLGPFFTLVFLHNLFKKQNLKFWLTAFAVGFVLFGLYFSAYAYATGDPLFRVRGIEGEHNVSAEYSFYGASTAEILQRITVAPAIFLLGHNGFGYLLACGIPALFMLKLREPWKLHSYFGICFLTVLLTHWFGTTSTQIYNPIALAGRLWSLLLPPLAILGALTFKSIAGQETATPRRTPILISLAILLALSGYILIERISPHVVIAMVYLLIVGVGISGLFPRATRKLTSAALFLPLFLYQLKITTEVRDSYYFEEAAAFDKLYQETDRPITVISDPKLVSKYDLYFGFQRPEHLTVMGWDELDDSSLSSMGQVYYHHHRSRTKFYGVPDFFDDRKESLPLVFDGKHIKVYDCTSSAGDTVNSPSKEPDRPKKVAAAR